MKMNKLALIALTAASAGFVSTAILAKDISMYDQPNDKAKVVGTVDLAAGIIPIYTPKDSKWIKIADPKNGNTGWVKSTDLSPDGSASFSFSTRFVSGDGSKNHGYQIIRIGGDSNGKSGKDMQAELAKLQEQQATIQQSVNKSISNMVDDMNKLYKQYQQMMDSTGMPVVMPVMLVPVTADTKTGSAKQPASK